MQTENLKKDLESTAYQAAEHMRDGSLTHNEALKILREKFPDLDKDVYAEALAAGLFASR